MECIFLMWKHLSFFRTINTNITFKHLSVWLIKSKNRISILAINNKQMRSKIKMISLFFQKIFKIL
jgi:hypothetical protein